MVESRCSWQDWHEILLDVLVEVAIILTESVNCSVGSVLSLL